MNALAAVVAPTVTETPSDIASLAATVDFATALKAQMAKDVRELARLEEEIGKLEALSKALKEKFAETGHDVVYAGNLLVTVSRTEDGEIFDADKMLEDLGVTKEQAIAQGYSKTRKGSATVKTGKLGRTNGPSAKIKDGKRVYVAEAVSE